jgi:hypothetical protein
MHVFQTDGAPPSNGRISLPTSGWTTNSSDALQNRVTENKKVATRALGTTALSITTKSRRRARVHAHGVGILLPFGVPP